MAPWFGRLVRFAADDVRGREVFSISAHGHAAIDYRRMLDVQVPVIYGPSADETPFD